MMRKKLIIKKTLSHTLDDVLHFFQKDLPTDLINSKSIRMFKNFEISIHLLNIYPVHRNNQEDYNT